jgi:LacI family transcriptional regulator
VQEYAKLKNYKPNVIGINLKNRSTKTIGVIVPNILNSFFAKVFSGIEKVADENGYKVIMCISNESLQKEINTLEMLSNGSIDGFILSTSEESQKLQQFGHFQSIINEGTPIVMFDRIAEEVICDKVVVDDEDAAINATEHLIKTGCRRIALFSSIDNLNVGKLRAKGFYQAFANNKIKVDDDLVLLTDKIDFENKIQDFFKANTIDGIFALDEHASITAMKLALNSGYKIPEDLSMIGFADGVWSRRLTPTLSTVSLIKRLESKEEINKYETAVVKTELRKRESTKKL